MYRAVAEAALVQDVGRQGNMEIYYDFFTLMKLAVVCGLIALPLALLIDKALCWVEGDTFKRVKKSDHGWTETIVCPECGCEQKATVTHHKGDPWPTFIHDCEECGYTITESEWSDGK